MTKVDDKIVCILALIFVRNDSFVGFSSSQCHVANAEMMDALGFSFSIIYTSEFVYTTCSAFY